MIDKSKLNELSIQEVIELRKACEARLVEHRSDELTKVKAIEAKLNPWRGCRWGARPIEDIPDWVMAGG
jgi:hypothetical protein